MLRLEVFAIIIVTMVHHVVSQNDSAFIGSFQSFIVAGKSLFNTGLSNNGYSANGSYIFAMLNANCSYELVAFVPYRRIINKTLSLSGYIESSAYVQGKYGTINSSLYSQ